MKNIEIINGHPVVVFYAVMEQGLSEGIAVHMRQLIADLAANEQWVIAPPEVINYVESESQTGVPLSVFGVGLRMYSALPPWNQKLSKETDRRHLQETEVLIKRLATFSADYACVFRIQLDNTLIGRIQNGKCDRGIYHGLIEEWKRVLDAQ